MARRNSYYHNLLATEYLAFDRHPSPETEGTVTAIATFLERNYLIGKEHVKELTQRIDLKKQALSK